MCRKQLEQKKNVEIHIEHTWMIQSYHFTVPAWTSDESDMYRTDFWFVDLGVNATGIEETMRC